LILLGLIGFAVMFTRDAVRFPDVMDLSRSTLTVVASPAGFTKRRSALVFFGREGRFQVRCDLNKAICENYGQLDGDPVKLELIRTSWLNQYLVVALTQDGREVSYAQAVSRELPGASREAWVLVIVMWLVVLFYGWKEFYKLK
jgi:hypothetical protein